MADPVITNLDRGSLFFGQPSWRKEILTLSGAQTVAEGLLLARDSVSSKLVPFYPGGRAVKAADTGPYNFNAGDTLVTNTNGGGNETSTFDAAAASITDTTSYAVTDQDTKTLTVTITGGLYDGEAQLMTFDATTTTALQVAAQFNKHIKGITANVVGGQVQIDTDGKGTDFDIAIVAGTSDLTFGSSTAGTGNAGDIDAVTAAEVKTVVEADTTDLTVTDTSGAAVFTASTSIQFVSGNCIAKMGLSVETVSANGNGTPVAVFPHNGYAGANGDNAVDVIVAGEVRDPKLVLADGSSMTDVIRDQLRNYAIIPIDINELRQLDNQ